MQRLENGAAGNLCDRYSCNFQHLLGHDGFPPGTLFSSLNLNQFDKKYVLTKQLQIYRTFLQKDKNINVINIEGSSFPNGSLREGCFRLPDQPRYGMKDRPVPLLSTGLPFNQNRFKKGRERLTIFPFSVLVFKSIVYA